MMKKLMVFALLLVFLLPHFASAANPPTPPTDVTIYPPFPNKMDTLIASASGSTPDTGRTLDHYEYSWNGGAFSADNEYDCVMGCVKDDVITLEAKGCDNFLVCSDSSSPTSITIGNAPPITPSPPTSITPVPSPAVYNSMLTCSAGEGSFDPDGDSYTYYYLWKKGTTIIQDSSSQTYSCSSAECKANAEISVSVYACDIHPSSCSDYSPSLSVTIKNTPPTTPTTPSISPTLSPPTVPNVEHTLHTSGAGSKDWDGPSFVRYWFTWKANGVPITAASGEGRDSLVCKNYPECSKGIGISVCANASDGDLHSDEICSDKITIQDAPPKGTISLPYTPSLPHKEDTINVVASGITDSDNDILTYYFNWTDMDDNPIIVTHASTPSGGSATGSFNCNAYSQCYSGASLYLNVKACDTSNVCTSVASDRITIAYYWQTLSVVGLLISILAVALIYMIGTAMEDENLKMLARDELFQIFATAIILAIAVSVIYSLNSNTILSALSTAVGGTSGVLQTDANTVTEKNLAILKGFSGNLTGLISNVGEQASKSGYCSYLGIGYSVALCGGYNAARGALSNALTSVSLAIADMQAQLVILELANNYMVFYLLPLGIFLRSFRPTRGAGGVLIALTLGFFIVFPFAMLLGEKMVQTALGNMESKGVVSDVWVKNEHESSYIGDIKLDCKQYYEKEGEVVSFMQTIRGSLFSEPILFRTIIHSVLMTILNLMITLTFIKWMAGFLGSEIDVYALVRIS